MWLHAVSVGEVLARNMAAAFRGPLYLINPKHGSLQGMTCYPAIGKAPRVDLAVIEECLRIALQAPVAHNDQRWHWIVVTDPERRAALLDLPPETQARLSAIGADLTPQTPAQFLAFHNAENQRYGELIRKKNIKLD